MYFVGIDISKYKHNCFIFSLDGEIIEDNLIITNDVSGFSTLAEILKKLRKKGEIRIGFEATGHYCINLKLFLEKNHHSFMELNPLLIKQFNNAQTLRRTKTDSIDCQAIAKYMTTIEYKPYPTGFYHMYSLKSLTRLRESMIRQRSKYMVQITNVLDHIFPEYKPFFSNRFSVTSLYILEKYRTVTAIANMNVKSYEHLHSLSRGHFSMEKFFELKKLAKNTIGESNEIFDLELDMLLDLYQTVSTKIDRIDNEISEIMSVLKPQTMTIKGVGCISAASIIAEFGDINRFKGPAQMLSFAGLEPGYYQSGIEEYEGHMVKRGSPHLRCAILNVCLPLTQHNPIFAEYYHKKREEGKPHRVALSHVAKKLIRVIYTLETRNIPYNEILLK